MSLDARPVLVEVARALRQAGLEAIMIGNAAAALQGAPVTTVDIDFFYRRTPANLKKLRSMAKALGAVLFQPHYPMSGLLRVMRDEDNLSLDFMSSAHGIRSFEGIRSRATTVALGGESLVAASLADIIKSARAAPAQIQTAEERPSRPGAGASPFCAGSRKASARPTGRGIGLSSMSSKKPSNKRSSRKAQLEALKKESDLALRDAIDRLLAKPPHERTHFLRKKVGLTGTAL